jgi:ribosome biogenesis GTPase
MFNSPALADLGWSNHFLGQLSLSELKRHHPARVARVHRDRLTVLSPVGAAVLSLPPGLTTGEIAVGDWVLSDPESGRLARLLDRKTSLARRAAGEVAREQLIAANVDTAFLTTSCNADFNPARIERYLALIRRGGIAPVILLTKTDMCPDPQAYLDRLRAIAPATPALALNARDPATAARLAGWCWPGQTVCFLGSSGVGKSTLANTLTGLALDTGAIREDDAKGRHTTTTRSMHLTTAGGWLIDTPGMRELRLYDAAAGIEATFADLADLARNCRFSDCTHESEPGCAVRAAIGAGTIDASRLIRWQKLQREDSWNSASVAELRATSRRFGRMTRDVMKKKRRAWDD